MLQDIRRLQRACPIDPLLERFAGDELHHQVRQRLFLNRIHLDDVLVPNLGRGPGLAQKPLAGGRGGSDLRGQHLDRDHALQRLVEGTEHDAEAPLAENFEHLVMPDAAERIRTGGRLQEIEGAVRVITRFFTFGLLQVFPLTIGSAVERQSGTRRFQYRGQGLADRLIEKIARAGVSLQQFLDLAPQFSIASAGRMQKGGSLGRGGSFQGREQQSFHSTGIAHERIPRKDCDIDSATK